MYKHITVSFLISFLDILTTYINIVLYKTCGLEFNAFVRSLCFADPKLIFLWMPVEAAVIFAVYTCVKRLREVFKVRLRAEYLFLALASMPIINNAIGVAMALATR